MGFLNNMNIRARFAIMLGILFLAVATIAITLVVRLGHIQHDFALYEEAGVAGETYVLKISRDMNYASRLGRSIMLGDDYGKNFSKLEKRIADIYSHFENLKKAAGSLGDTAEAKGLLVAIEDSERDTKAFLEDSRQRMTALGSAERTPEVLAEAWQGYKKGASPIAGKARKSFKKLIEMEDGLMAKLGDQTRGDINSITGIVLAVSAVVLVVALVLTLFIARSITGPLQQLRRTIDDIERDSDLTARIDLHSNDELGATAASFNRMLEKFHQIIQRVTASASQLSGAAEQVSLVTVDTVDSVQQQQAQVGHVATAMEEMTATVQEVARNAMDAANAAGNADSEAKKGQRVVNDTVQGINQLASEIERAAEVINRLEQGSDDIGKVLDVIKGIAEQTNLLALNAAIEAARAGEQGRGFAVVADEVRTLASRTQQSTEEIQAMIEGLQNGAREAVAVMGQSREQASRSVGDADSAGESLVSITQAVMEISRMNTQIASAADEQSSVAEEINQNIISISDAADRSAAGARQTSDASASLTGLATELQGMVSMFKS